MTTLLVGTDDGLYELGDELKQHLKGHAVGQVVPAAQGWWCVVDRKTVSGFGPDGWVTLPMPDDVGPTCLALDEGNLVAGTVGAHLVRVDGDVPVPIDAFEDVPGRDSWYTPWGAPPDARSLASNDGALYVNVHVGGIPRSTDGGRSWEPTIDVDADVHQVLAVDGWVLAACGDKGLAVSDDGGNSWTVETEGLHAAYCRAVAAAGDTVLVSASEGPRGARSAVYRRPLDGGARFERCRDGLPEWFDGNVDTFCVAAVGGECAVGTGDGRVFRSRDSGARWEQVAEGLPAVRSVVVLTSG